MPAGILDMSRPPPLWLAAAAAGGTASAAILWLALRRRSPSASSLSADPPSNVLEALYAKATGEDADAVALETRNSIKISWAEYLREVQAFSRALRVTSPAASGVAIHAFNCPQWFFGALGAMDAGWTVSGIYNTNTYDQAAHILKTSDVRVLVVEDAAMYESTYAARLHVDFPDVLVVVISDPTDALSARKTGASAAKAVLYEEFVAGRRSVVPEDKPLVDKDDIATLVYTSGTTGNPKAVALTHGNLHAVVQMALARVPLNKTTRVISYLPLSHIAAQAIDLFQPLYSGTNVVFATPDALKGGLQLTLLDARPTLFFGVPRVYEKIRAGLTRAANKKYSKPVIGPILKSIGGLAKWTASVWHSAGASDGPPSIVKLPLAPLYFFSKLVVFGPIRKALGLNRCNMLYTGAAPLRKDTQEYFRSIDMPLFEVYGMSESTGCMVASSPLDPPRPMGSCGRALPGCELIIAEDQEICLRGPQVMQCYLKNEEETRAVIDGDGVLHTGDLGAIDAQGWVFITGRKKELLITEGGENIPPVPIEANILKCAESAGARDKIGHILLIGDQRKCLMCLVAIAEEAPASLCNDSDLQQELAKGIAQYNSELAKSRAQKVQNFSVVEAFKVVSGELTPTMKMKRKFIERKYAELIDGMYSASPRPAA